MSRILSTEKASNTIHSISNSLSVCTYKSVYIFINIHKQILISFANTLYFFLMFNIKIMCQFYSIILGHLSTNNFIATFKFIPPSYLIFAITTIRWLRNKFLHFINTIIITEI